MTMSRLSLAYPEDPVDGYTLTFWKVCNFGDFCVHEIRVVFHVHAVYTDVVPEALNGAAFENEWALWLDGVFKGRVEGWRAYKFALDGCFSTYALAAQELRERLTAAISVREADIAILKTALAELEAGTAKRTQGGST